MTSSPSLELEKRIEQAFSETGIPVISVETRHFPGESIVIVEVSARYDEAVRLAGELDLDIPNGFVTVRRGLEKPSASQQGSVSNIDDERVSRLIGLINARSRTSEAQPSLRYIEGAAQRLTTAMAPRHHLIFGRRGVGKTALMLEAKRRLETEGAATFWTNVHPLRGLGFQKAFLTIAHALCDLPALQFVGRVPVPQSITRASKVQERIQALLDATTTPDVAVLLPQIQQMLALFLAEIQVPLYIFADDVHYLPMSDVPRFLDFLHAISRDNSVWLKIAGVKHQMRWFSNEQQVGLQTGHDADPIDLDVTLEEPPRARQFLEDVLQGYVDECEARPLHGSVGSSALDRLVLASGGVPRDFLTLCSAAIEGARSRPKARQVGVQDVNIAAGRATQVKLRELEGDAAASLGSAEAILRALGEVRRFLLTEHKITFMRVELHDKEARPREYAIVQSLMDLRMIHLIHSSLSDSHEAGSRSEVYLLDLSEYSASRLRQRLSMLDFQGRHLVWKRTRSGEQPEAGDTPHRLINILRRGPIFPLSTFSDLLAQSSAE
jgi:hypothetical protein